MTTSLAAVAPSDLQTQADTLREAGQTVQALNLYNQALVGFQAANDTQGILGVLQGRIISWQHLHNQNQALLYARLAQSETDALAHLARDYNIQDRNHVISFFKGKCCMMLKDYPGAVTAFTEALRLYPQDGAAKGDWLAHLGEATYLSGNPQAGISQILHGIEHIKLHASEVDPFQFNVWISGAYLRLAKLLATDAPPQSAHFLNQAEILITSDPRLAVRQKQLQQLRKSLEKSEKPHKT